MAGVQLLALIYLSAIAMGLIGLSARALVWAKGRPAPVEWSGLIQIPARYLNEVHHAVSRTPRAARMHVPVALGFVLTVAGLFSTFVAPVLAIWLAVSGSVLLAIGSVLDIVRRRGDDGRHLSAGIYQRFPWALLVLAVSVLLAFAADFSGLRPQWPIYAALAILSVMPAWHLSWGLAGGPLRHALAGSLTLAFHPRPDRFARSDPERLHSAKSLRPLNPYGDRLGAKSARDLDWQQLLNVDACIQCGKCEAACPAFAAGQPLNPKALIYDLAEQAGMGWAPYAGNDHPGRTAARGEISDQTLWSCTTCRACVDACPMMIEHVDAIVDMRRYATLENGSLPDRSAQALANLAQCGNQTGVSANVRSQWTLGLGIAVAVPGKPLDVLLWQGEGSFTPEGRRTLRAMARILKAAGVDFAIIGPDEPDCGDLARRIGDEALFHSLSRQVMTVLSGLSFNRLVTCDPHVFHCFAAEYPDWRWPIEHHSQTLEELIRADRLTLRRSNTSLTYHDPCYLGRYSDEFSAPRAVLAALGADLREMERSGRSSRCCGGGGGAPLADSPGKARIADQRMNDALETEVETVAVACPGCSVMLAGASSACKVRDIAEMTAAAMVSESADHLA